MNEAERKVIEASLDDLLREVALLKRQITSLDIKLKPVYERQLTLEEGIRHTHTLPVFNPRRAAERVPLYDGLMQIAVDHGKDKAIRGELMRRMSGYNREAQSIRKELEALDKKVAKAAAKKPALLL